jgi:hypothetical protein
MLGAVVAACGTQAIRLGFLLLCSSIFPPLPCGLGRCCGGPMRLGLLAPFKGLLEFEILRDPVGKTFNAYPSRFYEIFVVPKIAARESNRMRLGE